MGWRRSMDTYHLPVVTNYREALQAWDKSIKTRDRPERRWLKHNNRQQWVDKDSNGDIDFCLSGSDVVTYESGGDIVLHHSSNRNASAFADRLVPSGVGVEWGTSSTATVSTQCLAEGEWRYWSVGSEPIRLRHTLGAWRVAAGSKPFSVLKFDKPTARASLARTEYDNFRLWAIAIANLGGWRRDESSERNYFVSYNREGCHCIMQALADRARWDDLISSPGLTSYGSEASKAVARVLTRVREAIYATAPGIVTEIKEPYIDGNKVLSTYERARKEYGSLLLRACT